MASSDNVEDELSFAERLIDQAREAGSMSVPDQIAAAQVYALIALARAVDNIALATRR